MSDVCKVCGSPADDGKDDLPFGTKIIWFEYYIDGSTGRWAIDLCKECKDKNIYVISAVFGAN